MLGSATRAAPSTAPPCCGTLSTFARDFCQPHVPLKLKTTYIPGYLWRSAQQFCTGTHSLACGRLSRRVLHRVADSDLACKVCDTGAIEDERHFFCLCPGYSHLRRQYPALFAQAQSPSDCIRAAYTYERLRDTGHFLRRAFAHRERVLSTMHASATIPPQ